MSIRLKDLHEVYHTKTHEEAMAIANLGAEIYEKTQSNLYKEWNIHQTAEEKVKAELYRKEGSTQMLESLKPKLLAGDAAVARIETLTASIEIEVARRMKDELEKQSLLLEVKRVAPLQQRITQLESKEDVIVLLKEQASHLSEKLQNRETRIQELESKTKQSSHAIGKDGEQTVLAMIKEHVLPKFPFSRVEDKTGVEHAADFHLWTMPTPTRTVKILIDAKKYKTGIKQVEVRKLHSDLDGDEEAEAGLMLSLDSCIYNYSQFELSRTGKNKLVMYISLEGQSEEQRVKTLIWGVRVLTSLGGEADKGKQRKMVEQVEKIMKELETSVKEQDNCVRQAAKTLEVMKSTRDALYKRVLEYKGESVCESESVSVSVSVSVSESKCKWTKNGKKCSYKATGDYCKRHGDV
jgi:hypothetical protein